MKKPNDELIRLMDATNNVSIATPVDAITFDAPVVWTAAAANDWRNTEIVAHGVLEKGYSGSQVFHYRRPDLGQLFKDVIITVVVPHHNATSEDVVAEINKQFSKLDLYVGDMIHEPVPDEATSYMLTADPTSLYYIGAVEVIVERVLIDIAEEFKVTDLNGFDYVTSYERVSS